MYEIFLHHGIARIQISDALRLIALALFEFPKKEVIRTQIDPATGRILEVISEDDKGVPMVSCDRKMLLYSLEIRHLQEISSKIASNEIAAFDAAGIRLHVGAAPHEIESARITVQTLKNYVEPIGITVHVKEKPESPIFTGETKEKASSLTIAASTKHLLSGRKQELDAEIEKAKAAAIDPADYHSVWTRLKEFALSGELPFTGRANEKNSLEYTSSQNKLEYFSKDALRKRMKPNAR